MSKPFVAPTIYHDGQHLFLDWETYVTKFAFTEGGLSKALKTIPHIASHPGYVSGQSNIATKLIEHKQIKIARKTREKRAVAQVGEGVRQSASVVYRRLRDKVR